MIYLSSSGSISVLFFLIVTSSFPLPNLSIGSKIVFLSFVTVIFATFDLPSPSSSDSILVSADVSSSVGVLSSTSSDSGVSSSSSSSKSMASSIIFALFFSTNSSTILQNSVLEISGYFLLTSVIYSLTWLLNNSPKVILNLFFFVYILFMKNIFSIYSND